MGWVWRARSIGLDIDVAVKIARAGAVPHAGERLLREARVSARVRHPASVRVIELCRSEAGPLLVMELLQGRTLARALADGGPLAPLRAVTLLLPILGALAAAHREGIVHRDVKPTNIVLAEEGRRTLPKLIDFGIACVSPNEWSQRLTPHTPLLGSPAYMSPEQASGATGIDPRTDVWGACTVLYEAVSGERPFTGGDRVEITRGILTAPARRPAALAGYPALWRIIERGLQKAPADRWESMEALGAALAMWALDQGARCDAAGAGLAEEWCPRRRG
ncbi:MAG: serine/threonine protein kinase [Polyangiaceae bacterium]|nr:serine/threonine protein kinase [Polyangiaceae bacterium]